MVTHKSLDLLGRFRPAPAAATEAADELSVVDRQAAKRRLGDAVLSAVARDHVDQVRAHGL